MITWGFTFIPKARNDGKNKGVDGTSSYYTPAVPTMVDESMRVRHGGEKAQAFTSTEFE